MLVRRAKLCAALAARAAKQLSPAVAASSTALTEPSRDPGLDGRPERAQPMRRRHFTPEGFHRELDSDATRQLVVTASGPDQPGIVSRVSKRVLECGGNVEESRMARLAGDFSILMLVTVDAALPYKAEELRNALMEIEGLQVNTRWTTDDRLREKAPKRKFRRLSLKGADNPGLVYNVAEYLASNNINIENLETTTQEAPFGGSTLFTMDGVITMPIAMSTKMLMVHLDTLQATLGVEITLANLDPKQQADDFREWYSRNITMGKSKYSSSGKEPPPSERWPMRDIAI